VLSKLAGHLEPFGEVVVTTYAITVSKEAVLQNINATLAQQGMKLQPKASATP